MLYWDKDSTFEEMNLSMMNNQKMVGLGGKIKHVDAYQGGYTK
jgi:hypothetical protein